MMPDGVFRTAKTYHRTKKRPNNNYFLNIDSILFELLNQVKVLGLFYLIKLKISAITYIPK